MSKKTKNTFKSSLNLPQTGFPMRANLSQNEPQTIKRWDNTQLYKTILEKTAGNPPFVFHDGPPYANGHIHIGHLLNKVLKDIVVRSQNLLGKHCSFTPGWDCHGLPIEHRVLSELSDEKLAKLANLEEDIRRIAIRKTCARYAEKFIKLQKEDMKRLLTLADYEKPYLTMNPKFEAEVLRVFAELVTENIVFRQLKPVHWSIANQTALAEAELEYQDKTDTSVYVAFNATDSPQVQKAFNINTPITPSFMIWTTTPWTLPANLAIAVHEDYEYVLAESTNKQHYILAKERLEAITSTSEKILNPIATCKGKDLLGLSYQHPFCEREGRVAHANYVTLEDGSGLVHTAPGHGEEDYQTGQRENLDTYCPVQADGTYDKTVPDWLQGQDIWKANPLIVSHLEEKEALFYSEDFVHSYPHDWRSKTPVIFRSTEQWFIGVDKPLKSTGKSIREMGLTAVESEIKFVPDWGQNRLRGMLDSRPDWCISRQRSWGLPIPAFETENGETLLTTRSVQAVADLIEKEGSDAWFTKTPEELLQNYDPKTDPDAPQNLSLKTLKKHHDIFDVWFESGSSWQAALGLKDQNQQADLYLEGSDQHRGWFQLSLLLSLGVLHKPAFKTVLTHGFIVDKDGKKMSKSAGNALDVATLLKDYGADVCRWWVSSLSFENDIKVDNSYFNVASETYRKMRNTLRFLLSNLFDSPASSPTTKEDIDNFLKDCSPQAPEAYLMSELSKLSDACINAYEQFKFKEVNTLLYNFCNHTLSSVYCSIVKDRLYCDEKNSPRRRQSQKAMQITLDLLCRFLTPIIPHTAEETYTHFLGDNHNIHTQEFLTFSYSAIPEWETVMSTRSDVQKALEEAKSTGLENSLDCGVVLTNKTQHLSGFQADLEDIFGVSAVKLVEEENTLKIEDRRQLPRCERSWKRDASVKKRDNDIFLSERDYKVVKNEEL